MAELNLFDDEKDLPFVNTDPAELGKIVRQLMIANPHLEYFHAIMIVSAALNLTQNAVDVNADTSTVSVTMEAGDQWCVTIEKIKETQ